MSKKNLLIIIGLLIAVLLTVLIILSINQSDPLNKPKKQNSNTNIVIPKRNEVLMEYGNLLTEEAINYYEKNNSYPVIDDIKNNISYSAHSVSCIDMNITDIGEIILDRCKIDGKDIEDNFVGFIKEDIYENMEFEAISETKATNVVTSTEE